MIDIDLYLQRIGYTGSPAANLETLKALHLLHPLAIPFENISAFLGHPVSLDPQAVFDKLVGAGRGGYCFEQNLLFATILKTIGFTVTEHAARVIWRSPDRTAAGRTHMLLKVTVDGADWIADVGFGGLTMTTPLRLAPGVEQPSSHESFRIADEDGGFVISALLQDSWKPMYVFDLVRQHPVDFAMSNYFIATHPDSHFVRNLVLARPYRGGRHALENGLYRKYSLDGRKSEKTLSCLEDVQTLLSDIFRIEIGQEDRSALAGRILAGPEGQAAGH